MDKEEERYDHQTREIERTSQRLKQIEQASDKIADAALFVQETADQLRTDINALVEEKDIILDQQAVQDNRLDILEEENGFFAMEKFLVYVIYYEDGDIHFQT